jgi:hypothetical protein
VTSTATSATTSTLTGTASGPIPAQAGAPAAETVAATPGEQFAAAWLRDRERARVEFPYTVTEAFAPTKDRPRLTVANLFRKRTITTDEVTIWRETPGTPDEAARVDEAELRREAAFRFGTATAALAPVRAWVQVPEGIADDPQQLAMFVDLRLLVRLATAENQALTRALTRHPDIAELPARTFVEGVLAACDTIEQTGATPHAMIVNPVDYYTHLLREPGLLENLRTGGTLVVRTRMVEPGRALVGDFAMAARLVEGGRSVIAVAEPPPRTFARPGTAVLAEVHEGLAVHLPTHFHHVRVTG